MKNQFINLTIIFAVGLFLILGCTGSNQNSTTTPPNSTAPTNSTSQTSTTNSTTTNEKPIAVQAKNLTKEYEDNELAADGKYKDKMLAVSGKVSNIAETMGNITAQLEGHNMVVSVMCNFDESEKANVMKLKKGQQATFVGKGEGSTGGLYVGLQKCKIQ